MAVRAAPVLAPLAVAVIIACSPVPGGLSLDAWHYFAIFAGVIVALILEPIPPAASGLIGVSAAALLRLVEHSPADSARWALSGFGNSTVWLIFAAFVFALGYERTGLGRRLALLLVRHLGRRPIGLGFAVMFSDLVLAPFTPSNTARSAGTVYPVIRHIPALVAQQSPGAADRLGGYLMWTAFATTCVTSSLFLTGLAPNLLAVDIVARSGAETIPWGTWLQGIWPVATPLLVAIPLVNYVLFRPALPVADDVAIWARHQLVQMGRVTWREWTMAGLAGVALGLWVFGRSFVDATTAALVVVSAMVITRLVTWDDVIGHRSAWNVLVWFGTLVPLADGLARVGVVGWLAQGVSASLAGLSPGGAGLALITFFFVVHYLFASITAHVTAVLPIVLAAGLAVPGMNGPQFARLLCYSLGLMGVITPYATGPAPVFYASGYLGHRRFWGGGAVFGLGFLLALLGLAAATL